MKKAAYEKAVQEQKSNVMADGGKSLFDIGHKGRGLGSKLKPKNKARVQAEKVPFKINIARIGASL